VGASIRWVELPFEKADQPAIVVALDGCAPDVMHTIGGEMVGIDALVVSVVALHPE
jgi:hypothetical protein